MYTPSPYCKGFRTFSEERGRGRSRSGWDRIQCDPADEGGTEEARCCERVEERAPSHVHGPSRDEPLRITDNHAVRAGARGLYPRAFAH
jgi:hypothetical protein